MITFWNYAFLALLSLVTITVEENAFNIIQSFYSKQFQEDLVEQVKGSIYDAELSSVMNRKEWNDMLTEAGGKRLRGRSQRKSRCQNLLGDEDCKYLKILGQCVTRMYKLEGLCAKECGFCDPRLQGCLASPFGCCPDQVNAAHGPNFHGCPEECKDKRGQQFCKIVLRLKYCLSDHGDFPESCAFSCGFCRPCKDVMPLKCLHAATFGGCTGIKSTMMNNCRQTCNYCGKRDPCYKYKVCQPGSACTIHSDGKPICKCKRKCFPGDNYTGKVCGKDNREYKSLCELKQTICEANKELKVRNYGPCVYSGSSNRVQSPAKCKRMKDMPFCEVINKQVFCRESFRAQLCPTRCKLCEAQYTLPGCNYSKFGCCLDGKTYAKGTGSEGCSKVNRKCKNISKTLCQRFVALCGHDSHRYFMKKYCPKTCHWC